MKNADIPRFEVWRPETEDQEDARAYASYDAIGAARAHAAYYHTHRGGWEAAWPITFHVRNQDTGRTVALEVDREMEPVFWPGKPKEIT